jgi:hypothetical protein
MRSQRLKLIAFLLLITIKEPAMAEGLTTSEEMRSEIAALVAAEGAAWNRGSAEAFADRALPDIVFTNIFGMFSVGKAPFVAQHERQLHPLHALGTARALDGHERWAVGMRM